MTEIRSSESLETIYPTRCDGVCHLGPKALELVNGVLGRNCPGPALYSDETLVLQESTAQSLELRPTMAEDRDRFACANPRLVRALRNKIENQMDEAIIKTVEMEV